LALTHNLVGNEHIYVLAKFISVQISIFFEDRKKRDYKALSSGRKWSPWLGGQLV